MKLRLVTLALVSITTAMPLYAQDGQPDSIEARLAACDEFTDPDERLACFNDVARGLKKQPAETVAQPLEISVAKPEASVTPATVPPEQAPMPKADDFGRDSMKPKQEEKEKKKNETVYAVIVGVREHHDRRFSVDLDNDQVWRETEGSRVGMPKVGRTVKIKTGSLGGYRMTIEGIPKTAWVRRTK